MQQRGGSMQAFALATIDRGGKPEAAIRVGDGIWPLASASQAAGTGELPADLMAVVAGWQASRPRLHALAEACAAGRAGKRAAPAAAAKYLAPLLYPRKVIGVGANYADHVEKAVLILERMGIQRGTGRHKRPTFFLKPASTAVVGPGETVRIPVDCKQFDYEIELAVVFGLRARNVSEGEAMATVAAYTIGLDMSARDLHFIPESLFKFDAFAGKAHDSGAPLGPVLVPAEFVSDPQSLRMTLEVNGETRQDGTTADMVHKLPRLISEVSKIVTLEPGDVMLTGTPSGTGFETGRFLGRGDRIRASIQELGTLEVTVVD
jgi:2-keto-4-pentenoate hydratase/2-oxohepta-3-ene-1,7-dioic acid hydratase in catechol pathway